MTPKMEHALALAARGFRVFPLAINSKTPANEGNWRKNATTDPARIAEMWSCPVMGDDIDYNIGIALDINTLVVDVDVRNGKQGAQSLSLLEAIYDELPATYTVTTASGGEHRYFTVDDSGVFAKTLATDIDLKGEGGYVVGPGSTIDGKAYIGALAAPLVAAPLPEWVVDVAARVERSRVAVPGAGNKDPLVGLDSESAIARATDYLVNHAPEAIEGAAGDHTTIRVANRVGDFGISLDKTTELMLDWNDTKASPPWDHDELAEKVASAFRSRQNPIGVASPEAEFEPVALDEKTKLRGGIELTPVTPFDAADIPQRQWVLGRFAAKHYLSGIVSPPGVGKTTFLLMLAVAIATGRNDIVGMEVHQRGRVLIWNQEDELDELKRRLLAVMVAFDVKWEDIEIEGKPGIILGSGVDRRLMFAKRNASGQVAPAPDAKAISDFVQSEGVTAAIFDPFVEMHEANENDNPEVAIVGAVFRRVAVTANCAVILAHHTRKPPAASASDAYAGNMDTARGAGSLGGVARMVATLYSIDAATGKRYGVREEDCRLYVRFDDAKANMSLVSGEPRFFKREGVVIGGFGGEEVGVLRPCTLERAKDAKTAARDTLVEDVFELMGSDKFMNVPDMARALVALPGRAGENPRSLETAVKRTFKEGIKNDKSNIKITTKGTRTSLEREDLE